MRKLVLLVVLLALVGAVRAQTPTALTVVGAGDEVEGALQGSVTARLYATNLSDGNRFFEEMEAAGEGGVVVDPFMVLLGSSGEVLAYGDDWGDARAASVQGLEPPYAGTYLVLASTSTHINALGNPPPLERRHDYAVRVSRGTTQQTFDATLEINLAEIAYGESRSGLSTAEEPVFYYALNAEAGETFDIKLTSDDFDTLLYLFDPVGDRVGVNDNEDGTDSAIIGYEAQRTGQYLIFATDVYFYKAADEEPRGLPFRGGVFELSVDRVD